LIAMNVAAEHEPEFNEWYDTEHVPALGAVPGALCARRYRGTGATQRYVALSECPRGGPFCRVAQGGGHPVDAEAAAAFPRHAAHRMPAPHPRRVTKAGSLREAMNCVDG
jgi:hypothetical protein